MCDDVKRYYFYMLLIHVKIMMVTLVLMMAMTMTSCNDMNTVRQSDKKILECLHIWGSPVL